MYVTQSELEKYLKRTLTASEVSALTILGEAAKIAIDNFCDTIFDEVAKSSRYFDGGDREMYIDPCTEISEVASVNYDESINNVYADTNYIAEPRNKNVKWTLRKRSGRFPSGLENIKVTAEFSSYDEAIPNDVKLASLKLISDNLISPQSFKSESIEGYSYTMGEQLEQDSILNNTLMKYRQVYV